MATTTTIAAVVASNNNANGPYGQQARRPTPLPLPEDDDHLPRLNGRPRSLTVGSEDSDTEDSPELSAIDSSAALILVHDDPHDSQQFGFSDEDDGDEDDDIVSPIFEIRRTTIPALPPRTVFLYLLAPFLKFGALNILPAADRLDLKFGLPALFLSAICTAFSRQIWYMLARYLRKAEVPEVLCDTFAKARGKEKQRNFIRLSVKVGTAVASSLLAILYLHGMSFIFYELPAPDQRCLESVRVLLPFLPTSNLLQLLIVVICGFVVFFLSYAQSLSSKRVIFASWLSIFAYLAWFICAIYAHAKGFLFDGGSSSSPPSGWKGIFVIAFTFATSSTLPLYASLKSGINPVTTAKTPRSRSFRFLSFASIFCAILFLLPLVIFAARPNIPAAISPRAMSLSSPSVLSPSLPLPKDPTPQSIQTALAALSASTLLLGVAQPLLTIPTLPIRVVRTNINLTRVVIAPAIIIFSLGLSLVSSSAFTAQFVYVLTAVVLAISLVSTYVFPCVMHICVHNFKRPLAIVMPRTPMLPTPASPAVGGGSGSGSGGLSPNVDNRTDELLQRKERALQRKQFRKRIVWDLGVWVQLGLCAVGLVLAGSSLVQR
ncbi:hypothetical protein H1R20_g10786, partial [Candolleomyces eurysporus]